MCKHFLSLLSLLLLAFTAQAQQLTHLQGRVFLNDTLPAAYATLYLPQYGIGTVTDDQGNYYLDDIPVGNAITVEYAFLGYKTEQVKLSLPQPNHRYAHDHHMTEQPIQLGEVYLTPNGEDPCTYIFRKLHEQGRINRSRLVSYTAVCDGSLHVQDLDIFMAIIPGFVRTMMHGVLRTLGINALFNYLSGSEQVDVTYQYTQTWRKGKSRNSAMNILSAQPAISDKAQRQLAKMQVDDFFEMFYDKDSKYTGHKVSRKGWILRGVIEENGLTIDVLTRTETDSVRREYTCYIIEDLWSVLRYEKRSSDGDISRYECHDIGGGIYMPVLYVTNPIPINVDAVFEKTRRDYEEAKAQGKDLKMERHIVERYEKVINGRKSANINFATPYRIRYSDVTVM